MCLFDYYIFFHGFNALTLENNLIYSNVYTFVICTLLYFKITKVTYSYISSFFISAVEGYIHLLSLIKKAANSGNTSYFECKLQTSNDEFVCLVCYSPKKRESLQQAFASQPPVKIVGTKKNSKKCFNADTEDHCISKHAIISPAAHLSFPFNPSMGNRLHTVKQILQGDMHEIVDLKVKIIPKSQSKQSVMKNQVSMQKIDRYYCSGCHWYNQTNFMGTTDKLCSFRTVLSVQQSCYLYL